MLLKIYIQENQFTNVIFATPLPKSYKKWIYPFAMLRATKSPLPSDSCPLYRRTPSTETDWNHSSSTSSCPEFGNVGSSKNVEPSNSGINTSDIGTGFVGPRI